MDDDEALEAEEPPADLELTWSPSPPPSSPSPPKGALRTADNNAADDVQDERAAALRGKQKRQALQAQIRQLQTRTAHLERDIAAALRDRHLDGEGGDLVDAMGALAQQLHGEQHALASQLDRLRASVDTLQHALRQATNTPEFVAGLRATMEGLETGIRQLKEAQRAAYEQLLAEEKTLEREMQAFRRKIESWDRAPPPAAVPAPAAGPPARVAPASDLPPEVRAYDDFVLRHGGLSGGWDEYDHGMFMRHRARARTPGAHIAAVVEALPSKTREDVEAHERWYLELMELRERKNATIQAWKQQQEQLREEQQQQAAAEQQQQAERAARRARRQLEREEARRQEALQAVQQWRDHKEQEATEHARRAQREQERALKEQHRLDRQRQAITNIIINKKEGKKKKKKKKKKTCNNVYMPCEYVA